MTYFNTREGDDNGRISGDDVNRRYRESRLGFAEPSADWARCKEEIRCIWPNQTVTNAHTLTGSICFYHTPKVFLGVDVIASMG